MKSLVDFIKSINESKESITLDNIENILKKIKSVRNSNDFVDNIGEFLKNENCESLTSVNPDNDQFSSIFAEKSRGKDIVRALSFYNAKDKKYGYCFYQPKDKKIVGSYEDKDKYKKDVPDFYEGINNRSSAYLYKVPQELFNKIIGVLEKFLK